MPSSNELNRIAAQIQSEIGKRVLRATLGDGNGTVDVPGRPGIVYIQYATANGFSPPQEVPLRTSSIKKTPGAAVYIERDPVDGEMCIRRVDYTGQISAGTNPTINNPADDNAAYWIAQQRIVTLASHPISTTADSMEVTVQPWSACNLSDNTFSFFGGEKVDLTSYIPGGAGEWCLACLFLKTDMTIEVVTSTAKTNPDDLGFDDIEECLAGRSADSLPVWAWRLYHGQTGITPGAPTVGGDDFFDLRGIINTQDSGSATPAPVNATYITQTPDATLSAEQALSALATGLMKVTTATGVVSSVTDSAGLAGVISDETGTGALVFANTPTIVTPTIASFANANHDHTNSAGGGTLSAAAIASGQLALARGGTAADLSATGGANQFVKQSSAGAAFTVGTIADADVPNALTISGGTVDNTPIGATTPSTGAFTSLSQTLYQDFTDATTPATPSTDHLRVSSHDEGVMSSGFSELIVKDDTGLVTFLQKQVIAIVRNTTGSTVDAEKGVYLSGASNKITIGGLAIANSTIDKLCNGITLESIANNAYGRVLLKGVIPTFTNLPGSSGEIFLSDSSAGNFTNTAPTAPSWVQRVGITGSTISGNFVVLNEAPRPSTAPTFSDFTNANHDHTDTDDGGTLSTSAIASGTFAEARLPHKYAVFEEQQTTNTAGGASVATTWTARVLNTEVVDADGIVSLSSNRFTPVAGTFELYVTSPFIANATTQTHVRIRLYNFTQSSVVQVSSNLNLLVVNQGGAATMMTIFTANGSDAYEIQYYSTQARATNGLGIAVNEASAVERYTQCFLKQVG